MKTESLSGLTDEQLAKRYQLTGMKFLVLDLSS
jgi:hypothetical protein